jgi:hypothetical protein
MANPTYKLIASQVVGSGGASSIIFSSIPQTFTDLKLVISTRTTTSAINDDVLLTFNGATSGYSGIYLNGNGSVAGSGSNPYGTNRIFLGGNNGASSTSSTFSNNEVYIPNYASSNYKSVSIDSAQENNGTTANLDLNAGLYSSSSAISSLSIFSYSGNNFVQYSTFYLYGIRNS